MSSRQTYGCLGAVAGLFSWILAPFRMIAEEIWSAVILESWDRWRRSRDQERKE